MPKLPRISGREMVRFLKREGFTVTRARGSHHFMDRGDMRTCVPIHGNHDLKTGTLRSILRDIDMSVDNFVIKLDS